MDPKFRQNLDAMRDGGKYNRPVEEDNAKVERQDYDAPGNARMLCFVWPNGKSKFLNYAYLVSGDFDADNEANQITLAFTSHIVTLKGYALQTLFDALLEHLPRIITVEDKRYATIENEIVVDVTVVSV